MWLLLPCIHAVKASTPLSIVSHGDVQGLWYESGRYKTWREHETAMALP